MNTPQQQAELYRKAAETIEMCAHHGIEPMVKHCGAISTLNYWSYNGNPDFYEFPLAVIEGQLVWADTIVYDPYGNGLKALGIRGGSLGPYTLTQPKQPLCEVEGKPVYKGDKLYNRNGIEFIADHIATYSSNSITNREESISDLLRFCSWNPPNRTVMVELTVEDAERIANFDYPVNGIASACRKALDNLK